MLAGTGRDAPIGPQPFTSAVDSEREASAPSRDLVWSCSCAEAPCSCEVAGPLFPQQSAWGATSLLAGSHVARKLAFAVTDILGTGHGAGRPGGPWVLLYLLSRTLCTGSSWCCRLGWAPLGRHRMEAWSPSSERGSNNVLSLGAQSCWWLVAQTLLFPMPIDTVRLTLCSVSSSPPLRCCSLWPSPADCSPPTDVRAPLTSCSQPPLTHCPGCQLHLLLLQGC